MRFIYLITNLLNYKVYVGQTKNPKNRWSAHKCESKSDRIHFPIHKAIKKYGLQNFQFSILETCFLQDEADKLEANWIAEFDSCHNNSGYNLAVGGNVNSGWHHSEESKLKISNSNIGKIMPPHTDDWKARMSDIMTGRTIHWKDKISKSHLGKVFSEESKAKMAASKIGKRYAAKFTKEQEMEILNLSKEGFSSRQIAKIYQCSSPTICNIIKRNQ